MKRKEFLSSITFYLANLSPKNAKFQECIIKTNRVCDRCKTRLGRNIAFEKGVFDAVVDVKTKTILITYNPEKTTVEILKKYIVSQGFDADELKANVYKREEIRDCCLMDITICR